MPTNDLARMVDETALKLLQMASPPVRYLLLRDTLEASTRDMRVKRAIEDCRRYPPRVKLLGKMRPDGTWPIPTSKRREEEWGRGPPYGWTYFTMLRNLNDLADYETTAKEGHVRESMEKILSWQAEDGHIPGPWDVTFALPQYNGYALRMFIRFGMEKDPRVKRLMKWLLEMQRPDGGWRVPFLEDVKYQPKYRLMRQNVFLDLVREGKLPPYDPKEHDDIPSCIWTTMMVVRGFSQNSENSLMPEVRKGAEFFLDRFFKRNYHSLLYQSQNNWTKLRDPTFYGSGLLALDILTWLGYGVDDSRMHRPIKWLIEARSSDGLWHQSDRPDPRKAEWITEAALCTLRRYAKSLDGEPFGVLAEINKK
jgi:hypothetical protein